MVDDAAPERLILWDADFVIDWIGRNATYFRPKDRANDGVPAISSQTFAEVLRILRLRPRSASRLEDTVAEVKEQLAILDLTADRAEAYAEVVGACRRSPDPDVAREAWFAWQVALNRREGHRIMTKAPQRYRGLVEPNDLA